MFVFLHSMKLKQHSLLLSNKHIGLKYIVLLCISFSIHFSILGQQKYQQFKNLENRVKYTSPDSLVLFSETIDTSEVFGKAIKYWAQGKAHYWKSQFPEAYSKLELASSFLKNDNNELLKAELQLDLAKALSVVDQNGQALSYLLEANKIINEFGNSFQKSHAAISLAEMYRKIADFKNAFLILYKSKSLAEKNPYTQALCYNRLAAVHSETGSQDSSLYYSRKALVIAESINDPNLIATSENEIGYILRIQRKLDESLPHFYRADSLWKSIGMLNYALNSMHHISVVYGSMNVLDKSLEITRKAYGLIEGRGWYREEMNLLEDLRNLQNQMDNPDSAMYFESKRLHTALLWKDQQYSVNTRYVEIMFAQKENEQTIREQMILLENERLENEAISKERTILVLVIGLTLLLLITIIRYSFIQQKRKIKLVNDNLEKEHKNIKLEKALSANEALVQEISHRVKNNLAVLSGLLNMQALRSQNELVKAELQNSILRIESIATIHKQLYDKDSNGKVDLGNAVQELSSNILYAMGFDPKECLIINCQNFKLDIAYSVTFCLILNEVITNSCKYGGVSPENKIEIELKKENNNISCLVKDKGAGVESVKIKKKADSLGIYLIELLSKQLHADIKWEKSREYFIFSINFTASKNEQTHIDS